MVSYWLYLLDGYVVGWLPAGNGELVRHFSLDSNLEQLVSEHLDWGICCKNLVQKEMLTFWMTDQEHEQVQVCQGFSSMELSWAEQYLVGEFACCKKMALQEKLIF